MIMSLFYYPSFVHEGANEGLIKKLDHLQKRGLIICYGGIDLSEEEMYTKSGSYFDLPGMLTRVSFKHVIVSIKVLTQDTRMRLGPVLNIHRPIYLTL